MPTLSDAQFRHTFRLPRNIFFKLLKIIEPEIKNDPHTPGRQSIAPYKKLATFCKFLGSEDTVFQISKRFNMSASSFLKCRKQVVSAILECLLLTTITWPEPQEQAGIAEAISNWGPHPFPAVVGCVDGSRIPIGKPHCENPSAYGTAKRFSVTLQATCREDLRFTDVTVGCSGQMHDAEAFRNSSLYGQGKTLTGRGSYHILGDGAYPLLSWLMTYYQDHGEYNVALNSKLQLIRLALGRLKRRFQRLASGIFMVDLEDISNLILCACVLHNMCIEEKDGEEFEELVQLDPDGPGTPQSDAESLESPAEIEYGRQRRFFLTNTFFL